MDFTELESIEGLRFPWNSWPPSKPDSNDIVIPLSALYTPLLPRLTTDLPLLNYDPLSCSTCRSVLNPYARVNYPTSLWICPFCHLPNPFPKSHQGIGDHNLPAELFPTYSTVEYLLTRLTSANPTNLNSNSSNCGLLRSSSSSSSLFGNNSVDWSMSTLSSLEGSSGGGGWGVEGTGFVFVVDVCMGEEELRVVKGKILRAVAGLPESALVGLVSFGEMAWVHDLGFSECSRILVFAGDRELSSDKVSDFFVC